MCEDLIFMDFLNVPSPVESRISWVLSSELAGSWVLGGNSLLGSSKFQGTSFGFIEGTEAQFQF
jgi:hypothetical protein